MQEIRELLKEHTGPASAKLTTLRAHAEERNLNMALIERAETWIVAFQQECGETWQEPVRVFYDDVEPEIEFNWYSARNLAIGVTAGTVEYSAWDDAGTYDKDGDANTPEERAALWQWLREA